MPCRSVGLRELYVEAWGARGEIKRIEREIDNALAGEGRAPYGRLFTARGDLKAAQQKIDEALGVQS